MQRDETRNWNRPIVLPRPGSPRHYEHADEIARRTCCRCGEPINHRPFWYERPNDDASVVHDLCLASGATK